MTTRHPSIFHDGKLRSTNQTLTSSMTSDVLRTRQQDQDITKNEDNDNDNDNNVSDDDHHHPPRDHHRHQQQQQGISEDNLQGAAKTLAI